MVRIGHAQGGSDSFFFFFNPAIFCCVTSAAPSPSHSYLLILLGAFFPLLAKYTGWVFRHGGTACVLAPVCYDGHEGFFGGGPFGCGKRLVPCEYEMLLGRAGSVSAFVVARGVVMAKKHGTSNRRLERLISIFAMNGRKQSDVIQRYTVSNL